LKHHVKLYLDKMRRLGIEPHELVCERCGRGGGSAVLLDVYHISTRGMGGSPSKDTGDNLEALCRECHKKEHE
jgi:5-methylcytosine-specific restriction endonuclease McrA